MKIKNKHFDFEGFVRKLLEREVCSNLIEETGPSGGGVGKNDLEAAAILKTDDPIIPVNLDKVPIKKLLELKNHFE